jgi:hypothetical protein
MARHLYRNGVFLRKKKHTSLRYAYATLPASSRLSSPFPSNSSRPERMNLRFLLAAAALALVTPPALAADPQSLADGLARRVEQHGDHVLDILIVSGSGQAGAFGAGYLRGWRTKTGADAMPTFDLTLGTGTGGALAAFAYDGRDDAIGDASVLYTEYVTRFAAVPDHLRLLEPTRRRTHGKAIDAVIDRAVLGRAESIRLSTGRDDRQLIIATTDLTSGRRNYWDIGRELALEGGEDHVRQVFRAASNLPSQDRAVHVRDRGQITGTVGGDLPFGLGLADFEDLGRRLAADRRGPVTVRVWTLVDLWTDPVNASVKPSSERQVTRRAAGLSELARTRAELSRLIELSRAVTASVPGVTMQAHWIAVPQDQAVDRVQDRAWDREWPKRLETAGYAAATSAAPWRSDAPREVPLP